MRDAIAEFPGFHILFPHFLLVVANSFAFFPGGYEPQPLDPFNNGEGGPKTALFLLLIPPPVLFRIYHPQ